MTIDDDWDPDDELEDRDWCYCLDYCEADDPHSETPVGVCREKHG